MLIEQVFGQDTAAAGSAVGGAGMLMSYLPIVLIFGIFYMLVIRPQNQAAKAHAALLQALKKGDVVLLEGGLIGEVVKLGESIVHIRLAEGVQVAVSRPAVRKVLKDDEAKGWEPAVSKK